MILTQKQEQGLKTALKRYRKHEKYTIISGYAGTGKSTLVKFIISGLNLDPNEVAYAAYTGKAAEVLRKKGNQNACTLHRLLYDHIPLKTGGFKRIPKLDLGVKVVVVDEISMVPQDMINMLLRHPIYMIGLGDPYQLPPVNPKEANSLLKSPHVFLDQIMRQAEDSEIIRLSMQIREKKPLEIENGQNVKIFFKKDLSDGMLLWADQVLVATNADREGYNQYIRKLKGYEDEITIGEKLICLQNYWDDFSSFDNALVNGTIGTISMFTNSNVNLKQVFPYWSNIMPIISTYYLDLELDNGECYRGIHIDKTNLLTGSPGFTNEIAYKVGQQKDRVGNVLPKIFTYGYAITTHKAQGSEWDKVLVIENKFPFSKEEHSRWLYTSVTRAADKLVLVRSK